MRENIPRSRLVAVFMFQSPQLNVTFERNGGITQQLLTMSVALVTPRAKPRHNARSAVDSLLNDLALLLLIARCVLLSQGRLRQAF